MLSFTNLVFKGQTSFIDNPIWTEKRNMMTTGVLDIATNLPMKISLKNEYTDENKGTAETLKMRQSKNNNELIYEIGNECKNE